MQFPPPRETDDIMDIGVGYLGPPRSPCLNCNISTLNCKIAMLNCNIATLNCNCHPPAVFDPGLPGTRYVSINQIYPKLHLI